jgi:hypothetical protein
MTHRVALKHQFVEFIPEDLAEDTLYISIRFATASHLCCCGCRKQGRHPVSANTMEADFLTARPFPSVLQSGTGIFPADPTTGLETTAFNGTKNGQMNELPPPNLVTGLTWISITSALAIPIAHGPQKSPQLCRLRIKRISGRNSKTDSCHANCSA